MPGPDGGSIVVYNFGHSESNGRTTSFAGDEDLATNEDARTKTSFNVVLIDGLASVESGRDAQGTRMQTGSSELQETNEDDYTAGANAGPSTGGAAITFSYLEEADSIAIARLAAAYCADPGIPLAVEELPEEARTVLGLALALACGAPPEVTAPLFLLSPCIVVPVVWGTAFTIAYETARSLPAGGEEIVAILQLAEGTGWQAHQDHVGCRWMTIPPQARNPQPALAAADAANEGAGAAEDAAFPAHDAADGAIDAVFGAGVD